jgi:hypothetical protein
MRQFPPGQRWSVRDPKTPIVRALDDPRHPCNWKQRYATWDEAEEVCLRYQGTGNPALYAYPCQRCHCYHLAKLGAAPIAATYYEGPRLRCLRDLYVKVEHR